MVFRINRLRVVTVADAGFSDLEAALPDGAGPAAFLSQLRAVMTQSAAVGEHDKQHGHQA